MQKLLDFIYPLILIVVFGLLFFTGLGKTVVVDHDEALNAEVSRAMYLAGDPIIPKMNGEEFFDKPPLLYWAQMLGYRIFGTSSLGARFLNTVGGLLTLLTLYFAARRPLGSRTAFNAALILGSSIVFVYLSRIAVTDMLQTLLFVLCLSLFWQAVEREIEGKSGTLLFWAGCLCAGGAMLTMGTIGALLPVVTGVVYLLSIGRFTLLFKRQWIVPGILILLFAGFSWYLLLGFVHPGGFGFMKELFVKQQFGMLSGTMEGYSNLPAYYLVLLIAGFMPWFLYLPIAIYHAPLVANKEPATRFLRIFIVLSVLVLVLLSVAATKLPISILPALPGFALMLALLFNRTEIRRSLPWRLSGYCSAFLSAATGLALIAVPLIFPYLAELLGDKALKAPALTASINLGFAPWFAGAIFLLCSALIFSTTRQSNPAKIIELLLCCSFLMSSCLALLVLPLYDRLMDAPLARIAARACSLTPEGKAIFLFELDNRPSINFVSQRRTIERSEPEAQELVPLFSENDIRVGITSAYYFNRLQSANLPVEEIGRDTGFVLFRLSFIAAP